MIVKIFKMPEEMVDYLETESERTGASQAEIVRRAVKAYSRQKKIRERDIQEDRFAGTFEN